MKSKLDILHIYAGTGGSAGLYIDNIFRSLNGLFSQDCIVNAYFPFDYGVKAFYKYTEMSGKNIFSRFTLLRYSIRYIELICALIFTLFYVLRAKPKVVNYSLNSHFTVEFLFFILLKKFSKSKLIITCHDVVPFDLPYADKEKYLATRKKFFDFADYLIVHNDNSIDDLQNYYSIDNSKILKHKFPIMDLRKIEISNTSNCDPKITSLFPPEKTKFSFVGHFRKEKGIQVLLDSWTEVNSNCYLNLLGNLPKNSNINFTYLPNVNILERFLSDLEYSAVIKLSDFVVLPYTRGTNSGIPSSVISLGTIPIVSNIDMFTNNELILDELFFESGSPNSLSAKVNFLSSLNSTEISNLKDRLFERFENYQNVFESEIVSIYQNLIR